MPSYHVVVPCLLRIQRTYSRRQQTLRRVCKSNIRQSQAQNSARHRKEYMHLIRPMSTYLQGTSHILSAAHSMYDLLSSACKMESVL